MTELVKSCYHFALLFFWTFLGSEVRVNGLIDSQPNIRYFLYQSAEYPRDCLEAVSQCSSNNAKSGVYMIKPDQYPEPFEVYCDNNLTSDGWTVIQRRFDNFIGYNRDWTDYKYGFGFLGSEFWIGNEKLAHLTNQKRYKLLIKMENTEGQLYVLTYDDFRISDEWDHYSLSSVGTFNKRSEFNITWCVTNKQNQNGSICERSCENPNDCIPSDSSELERCVCQENHMFHDGSCIPKEQCGCYISSNNFVLPENESYITSDCSSRVTCSNNGLTRETYGCSNDATCEETNGVGVCICNEWFEGDGLSCTRNGPRDCLDLQRAGRSRDMVYAIYPVGNSGFDVYCDMSGGGWTIVQKRTSGSLSFYQNWNNYKDGFGTPGGDHWLGNDKIHTLTNQPGKVYQLYIEKTNREGASYHTRYSSFSIGNEGQRYQLSLGTYNGNAGNNAMGANSGYRFSTHDQDNDGSSDYNCAEKHRGGWWYPDDSNTGTTEHCYTFGNRAATGRYEYSDCNCYSGCIYCGNCCNGGSCYGSCNYYCSRCGEGDSEDGDCSGCTWKHYKCTNCDGCSGYRRCRNKNEIYETTNYSCGFSNLNGEYQHNDNRGIFWKNLHGSDCGITQTKMKIRAT